MSLPHAEAMQLVDRVADELGDFPAPGPVLGWDALRSLAREGVSLCSHTRTHPALNRLPPEQVRSEIAGSRADLEREIGETLPAFAYPAGQLDEHTPRILAEEGFELAFTTRRGLDELATAAPLLLRRVPVSPRSSEPVLRAQLLGWTAALQRSAASRAPGAIAAP
jgi:peptidoglycan/xylan/chitin deacetylase (PgdA/CDA1 family)